MSIRLALCVLLLSCARAALADGLEGPPDASGQKTWLLSDFLKGTAAQIQKTLNSECVRLSGRRNVVQTDLRHAQEALVAAQKSARDRLTKDLTDLQLRQTMTAADERRAAARAGGTMDERLDASSAFVAGKQAVDKYELQYLAADRATADAKKAIDEAQRGVAQVDHSLVSAFRWRQQLVDATRSSFRIKWPLTEGKKGIFGDVRVVKVIDETSALVRFEAAERLGDEKQEEGIVSFHVLIHPQLVLLTGLDAGSARADQTLRVDRTYTIRRTIYGDDFTQITVARRTPDDLDQLFERIDPLPEGLTADAVDAIEKQAATHKKADPKTWTSVQAILAVLPSDKRPAKGYAWEDKDKSAANDWFGGQIIGDKLDVTMTLRSAELGPDGGFVLHAVIDFLAANREGIRNHEVTAHCPATLMERAKKMHIGRKSHIFGTIQDMRAIGFDEVQIELSEVAFKD